LGERKKKGKQKKDRRFARGKEKKRGIFLFIGGGKRGKRGVVRELGEVKPFNRGGRILNFLEAISKKVPSDPFHPLREGGQKKLLFHPASRGKDRSPSASGGKKRSTIRKRSSFHLPVRKRKRRSRLFYRKRKKKGKGKRSWVLFPKKCGGGGKVRGGKKVEAKECFTL